MRKNPPNTLPVLAGDVVAVLADAFNRVYAFSKATGKHIWTKDVSSSVLASDGTYFYIVRTGYWELQALDPGSGSLAWSLQLPDLGPGYPSFLTVHDDLLFIADLIISISKRAVVHQWPKETFYTDVVVFGDDGAILIAGSPGVIAIYDKNFNRLRKMRAGRGQVMEVVSAGEQILVLLEQGDSSGIRNTLVSLTREGKRLWRIRWPFRSGGFAVAGQDVLTIEPGRIKETFRLTSRQLSHGRLNWATRYRRLYGVPAVCGDTTYVSDVRRLRSFNLQTGVETTH